MPILGWASSGAPRERKNTMYCSSSARLAPLANARWSWRASLSSGRTAITSVAWNVPVNAARLTRERVAEPYWSCSMRPMAADGQSRKARQGSDARLSTTGGASRARTTVDGSWFNPTLSAGRCRHCRGISVSVSIRISGHTGLWDRAPVEAEVLRGVPYGGGAGERCCYVLQQGAGCRGGHPVQGHLVQRGAQAAKRGPVGAGQRQQGHILAVGGAFVLAGGDADVGVEHREQAARGTGRLPRQPDRHDVTAVCRVEQAHPDQRGGAEPGRPTRSRPVTAPSQAAADASTS